MKGIFEPPCPFMKRKPPQYPKWDSPDREPPPEKVYQLNATDFNVSLNPSLKCVSFREYDQELHYRLITNDGSDQNLIWLTMARNIFHQELSQMPEHYISRLVFNRCHYTCVFLLDGIVFGGICFRPFPEKDFAEIAFCAVSSRGQIRGFGSHIMSRVKHYLQVTNIHNILTYADNSATGYFRRQGFTYEINLHPDIWSHCIKDYQGATLIHCHIDKEVDYLRINDILDQQLQYTSQKLPYSKEWIARAWPIRRIHGITIDREPTVNVMNQMRIVLDKVKSHSRSWPFRKPVSKTEAPNYYEMIKNPMDLLTLEKNANDGKYKTFAKFEADLRLIFSNCYQYNNSDSVYNKSAVELEKFVNQLISSQQVRAHQRPTAPPLPPPPPAPPKEEKPAQSSSKSKNKKKAQPASPVTTKQQQQQPAAQTKLPTTRSRSKQKVIEEPVEEPPPKKPPPSKKKKRR